MIMKSDNIRHMLEHEVQSNNEVNGGIGISFIGSGNYARLILIPAFKKHKALAMRFLSSNIGLSSTMVGEKYGFKKSTANLENIFDDKGSQAVIISARHDSHADLIIKSIKSGRDVYVEKPMCLTLKELDKIRQCYNESYRMW